MEDLSQTVSALNTDKASIVWWLCTGNLFCYIPQYIIIRMATGGLFSSLHGTRVTGIELLPLYAIGDLIAVILFLCLSGWMRHISWYRAGPLKVPKIRWYVIASGVCTIGQIITATWAYAFTGISIVFAALLMKAGVLIAAPIVDLMIKTRKRTIYWPSWIAAILSLFALAISFLEKADTAITLACIVDIALYVIVHFIKFSIMSKWSKNGDILERRVYVVGEQIIVSLGFVAVTLLLAVIGSQYGSETPLHEVWRGLFILPRQGFVFEPLLLGMIATGTGLFSTMILLDHRENTFCIAAVQSASIIASTIATWILYRIFNQPPVGPYKITSIIIVIGAIGFLVHRSRIERKVT